MRQIRPDWLIVWGSQSLGAAALESAQRAGFPRERMLGGANAAGAAEAGGEAAQGFVAALFSVPGDDPAPIRDIRRFVYGRGEGELADRSRLGSLSYNRGVVFGILTAEAVRVAQEHFKTGKPVSAQQAHWGLEHLSLDSARLEELGAAELMPPVATSCADHEGSGYMRFMRWDGSRWRALTDWMAPLAADRSAVSSMYTESASAYAKGKGIQPKNCAAG
jgi:branched-chain amino acid transport system substrate-binding protein